MSDNIDNMWILEEHDFTINDAEFKKNYMHATYEKDGKQVPLLTKEFLGEWIAIFGKPTDYEDEPEYYLRLAFGLVGKQITDSLSKD